MQCLAKQVLLLRWTYSSEQLSHTLPCTRGSEQLPRTLPCTRAHNTVRKFSSDITDTPTDVIPVHLKTEAVLPALHSPSWEFLLSLLKVQSDNDPDLSQTLKAINDKLLDLPWERDVIKNNQDIISHIKRLTKHSRDQVIRFQAKHVLTCCGIPSPCLGNGIRMLAIDGGGTRGIIAISVLKKLESLTGRKAHELFDYCIGTSTGALLISMAIARQRALDEVQDMYIRLSKEVFGGRSVLAMGRFVWKQHRYATSTWENLLQQECGDWRMSSVSSWDVCPQIAFVSTVVNHEVVHPYVFRSYGTPAQYPLYRGCYSHRVWEGLRATTAAPGYFRELQLGPDVHIDGALLYNNPTALGLHESKRLWPKEKFQCVVSIGTGRLPWRYQPTAAKASSLKDTFSHVIDSCTETESTHNTLKELLGPEAYYRFNPLIKEITPLDEINSEVLKKLQKQTHYFISENEPRFRSCAAALTENRSHFGNFWSSVGNKL